MLAKQYPITTRANFQVSLKCYMRYAFRVLLFIRVRGFVESSKLENAGIVFLLVSRDQTAEIKSIWSFEVRSVRYGCTDLRIVAVIYDFCMRAYIILENHKSAKHDGRCNANIQNYIEYTKLQCAFLSFAIISSIFAVYNITKMIKKDITKL